MPPSAGTGTGVPLAFSDQSGSNMAGKKLYKADLRGTNFANADLSGASLFGAFAKDASFKCGPLSAGQPSPALAQELPRPQQMISLHVATASLFLNKLRDDVLKTVCFGQKQER